MTSNFIRTTDKPTALLLEKLGFQKVDNSNQIYTFLNTAKLQFSNDIDINKIQYSNVLTL